MMCVQLWLLSLQYCVPRMVPYKFIFLTENVIVGADFIHYGHGVLDGVDGRDNDALYMLSCWLAMVVSSFVHDRLVYAFRIVHVQFLILALTISGTCVMWCDVIWVMCDVHLLVAIFCLSALVAKHLRADYGYWGKVVSFIPFVCSNVLNDRHLSP